MSRRSRPPRNRKSAAPDALRRQDVVVIIPPTEGQVEALAREADTSSVAPPGPHEHVGEHVREHAELAELDAGWD
jgi:hypothetical protein